MRPRATSVLTNRRQGGFTLVELMVSIAIGLLIVAALIALLVNLNRNNNELAKTNRMIENGRFAVQIIETDLVHAGFWGGFVPRFDDLYTAGVPADVPAAVSNPCTAYTAAAWNAGYRAGLIGIPVAAFPVAAVPPNPPIAVCTTGATPAVAAPAPSSDVIVVRYAEKCSANCLQPTAVPLPNDAVFLQVERAGDTIPVNGYVLADGAVPANFTARRVDGVTPAELRRLISHIYYVTDVNGVPTLVRSRFGRTATGTLEQLPAEPLIEGVQAVRIEFGLDTLSDAGTAVNYGQAIAWADATLLNSPTNRGDGVPDGAFVRCPDTAGCTAAQLVNAVAARIHVLVRSELPTPGYVDVKTYNLGGVTAGPFNDNFKRHVFTQTVRFTNISSRRETP